MRSFRHILVPTDFGRPSSAAIELATDLAHTFESELTLLHVWELPDSPNLDFMLDSPKIARVEDEAVTGLAEELRRAQARWPATKAALRNGVPWRKIIDAVDELRPDLIVVGTHGRHGLSHAFLGSVAEKIVRLSSVPVLTVHAPPAGGRD